MKALKVEWVYDDHLYDNGQLSASAMEQVVRLAEVDAVIAEAVWAMEDIQARVRTGYFSVWEDHDFPPKDEEIEELVQKDLDYRRAQAFLARPDVAAWRDRQEGAPWDRI